MSGDADDRMLLPPGPGEDVAVEWHEVREEDLATLVHGPLHARTATLRRLWPAVDRPPAPLEPLRRAVEQGDGDAGEARRAAAVPLVGGLIAGVVLLLFAPEGGRLLLAGAVAAAASLMVVAVRRGDRGGRERRAAARAEAVAALRRHAFVHRGPGTLVVHLAAPRAEVHRAAARLGRVAEQLEEVRAELDGAREIAREVASLPVTALTVVQDAAALQEHRGTVSRLAADRRLLADQLEARLAELVVPGGGRALDLDLGPLLDGVDALVEEATALHHAVVPSDEPAAPR